MSFAELCGLVSIPSCVRVSNAVVILSLISFLSFGWCWAALRSRHISSIPCVIVSLMDRASLWAVAADMSKEVRSLENDLGNHPAHVVLAPGLAMSLRHCLTFSSSTSNSSSELSFSLCVSVVLSLGR